MKSILSVATFLFASVAMASASCPNFSGTYATETEKEIGLWHVWTQTDCAKMNIEDFAKGDQWLGDGPFSVGRQSWKTDGKTYQKEPGYHTERYEYVGQTLVSTVTYTESTSPVGMCIDQKTFSLDAKSNLVEETTYYCDPERVYHFREVYLRLN